MRRPLATAAVAALALVASTSLAGAGFNPIITGVATCNTSTGQYDVVWTLSDVQMAGPFDITNPGIVTATPGAVVSNVLFAPTTVVLNGSSFAAGPVPGTTTSANISVFANGAPRSFNIGAPQGLLGTCVVAAGGGSGSSPATAIESDPNTVG